MAAIFFGFLVCYFLRVVFSSYENALTGCEGGETIGGDIDF